MSDAEDAARALDGFMAISDDDPRLHEFREAVIENLTTRPSPVVEADPLAVINDKLDEILVLLRREPQ